jgi:hypothetical protein
MSEPRMFPNAPDPACPKCGHPYGFASSEPEYRGPTSSYPPTNGGEHLVWPCRYCGFLVLTPTIDASRRDRDAR